MPPPQPSLSQQSFRFIPGATFSNAYTQALRKMDDYRITENLKIIDCINDILARVDAKIGATVDGDPDA